MFGRQREDGLIAHQGHFVHGNPRDRWGVPEREPSGSPDRNSPRGAPWPTRPGDGRRYRPGCGAAGGAGAPCCSTLPATREPGRSDRPDHRPGPEQSARHLAKETGRIGKGPAPTRRNARFLEQMRKIGAIPLLGSRRPGPHPASARRTAQAKVWSRAASGVSSREAVAAVNPARPSGRAARILAPLAVVGLPVVPAAPSR